MNTTIAWITARGLFGRRRFLLLLPLPLVLVGMAWLGSSIGRPDEVAGPVLIGIGVAVVLPLIALIVGTGVLGSEIDDGTIVHILTKPVPRWKIVLSKLFVAFAVSAAVVAVAMFVAAAMVGGVRLGFAFAGAGAVGALAYSALFLALSLLTRRPVLLGLIYITVWEGLLGNLVSGTRVLSVQQYVVTLADRLAASDLVTGSVSLGTAVIMSAVFTVVGTYFAVNRLRLFSVAGETS